MKKRIVSLVLLTAMAMPMIQPITAEYSSVAFAEEATAEEYTSELNPVKPSEAADEYVIKFKSEAIKKAIQTELKLESEVITVGDLKKFSKNILNVNLDNSIEEVSLEGLQYLPENVINISMEDGRINLQTFDVFRNKELNGIVLNNMGLSEVPVIEHQKNLGYIGLQNNSISNINGILKENYPELTYINLSGNLLKNIDELGKYTKFNKVELNGNKIEDISPLKSSSESIQSMYVNKNRINNEGIKKLFVNNFPKMTTADFSYNAVTDFSPIQILMGGPLKDFKSGKQSALVITDDGRLNLNMIYFRAGGKGQEVKSVELDESKDIVNEGSGSYSLTDNSKQELNLFQRQTTYNGTNEHIFSLFLKVINVSTAKELVEKAISDPTDENVTNAKNEIEKLKKINLPEYENELSDKIAEFENKLTTIEHNKNDYVSVANATPAHLASDEQEVNFTDVEFKKIVQNAIKRERGLIKDNVTVGDMRNLEKIDSNDYILRSDISSPHFAHNLEGIQYATNLKQMYIRLKSQMDIRIFDENYIITNIIEAQNSTNGEFYMTKFDYPKERLDKIYKSMEKPTGLLEPMKNLRGIEVVHIGSGDINSKDIKSIKELKKIRNFYLIQGNIDDVSPFKDFPELKHLVLQDTLIRDASPIRDIESLEKLMIAGSSIKDYEFLRGMNNLKGLDLSLNRKPDFEPYDIEAIGTLEGLESLSLPGNGIVDISPINNLGKLKSLSLEGNYITDLSKIKNLEVESSYTGSPDIKAYIQHIRVASNKEGIVRNPLKDKLGKEVPLTDEYFMDPYLESIGMGEYRLKVSKTSENIKDIVFSRKFDAKDYKNNGVFSGTIFIFNRNVAENIVNRALKEPSKANVEKAYEAVRMLNPCLELRTYAAEAKAQLDALSPTASPESVALNKDSLSLKENQSEKLTAKVSPANATNKDIEWSSSNAGIAKVDASGNVTAVAEGNATITAKVKGTDITAKADVTVTKEVVEKPDTDVKATSVRLNSTSAELKKDETYQLKATVNPTNSTQKDIEWSSTNNSVATVDGNGLVKAVGEGTATVRARVKGTEVSTTAAITVKADEKPVKAESIELDASKVDMQVEQKDKLVATVKPEKAENKEVEWSSSDENVVKVDANGNIEAVGAGTAKVTAKVKGTDIKAEAEIVVTEKDKPVDTTTKFTDINGHWAKAFIEHAFARGLFKGTTETLFSPESNMTRGMFVTVLGRLAEETAEPNDKFSDVNSDVYYAEYIAWAEENGIVEGYGNGEFRPDNNVTREEMAAIIERYMEYKKIDLDDNNTAEFKDNDKVSDWAKESVAKIQKAGIIEGKGNGIFDPQANSTRAEVATLLIRMIEKYID